MTRADGPTKNAACGPGAMILETASERE